MHARLTAPTFCLRSASKEEAALAFSGRERLPDFGELSPPCTLCAYHVEKLYLRLRGAPQDDEAGLPSPPAAGRERGSEVSSQINGAAQIN